MGNLERFANFVTGRDNTARPLRHMEKQIRISLIVATYNRGPQLMRTLRSIAGQTLPKEQWEAVVVNNNSTDDTHALFARFASDNPQASNVRMVFEPRQGLSHARNRGIGETVGEYVALIDDDEEMNPEFLRQYMEFFDAHPDAAAAGGKIEPLYEYETPKWLSPWVERPLAAMIDMGGEVKQFRGENYPIGGNMAFRREAFDRIGLFNPELGRTGKKLLGGEEKDVFERIKRTGGKIYWVPGPRILHIIPQSRLTPEYFGKLTKSIGISERTRTRSVSKGRYMKRLFSEAVKWGGTCVLALGYALRGQGAKGRYLFIMRRNITAGLTGMIETPE